MVAQRKSHGRLIAAKKLGVGKPTPSKSRCGREHQSDVVPVERRAARERRGNDERRTQGVSVTVERRVLQRREKVSRRRQIDPTTCERDYTPDEVEFMGALDEYKRLSGRMFPTCSEVLEVLKKLGYEKHVRTEAIALPTVDVPVSATPDQAVV